MAKRKTKQATAYRYEPDYAVAPGKTLQETIAAKGMDQRELAKRTGLSVKHVNQIVKGAAALTHETAIRLERVTGVPAKMWNNLEAEYREQLARVQEKDRLKKDLEWLKGVPAKELIKRGVIQDQKKEPVALLEEVLRFFGVANVAAWQEGWNMPQFAFRKSLAFKGKPGAMATWLRLCELKAQEMKCSYFIKSKFKTALESIRELTIEEPATFVPQMTAQCAEAGVALALVPEIKGAPVSGAAKWLAANKAMIGMTLRGKSNDRFWFTFFHEAGHILNDSKKETYIDVDYADDERERSANEFAANYLIPPNFADELRWLKTHAAVESFAASIGIAPGIVVGRLQREEIIPYSHLNSLKVPLEWGC